MTLMEDKMENLVENYNYDNSIFEFREKARLEFVQKFPLENLKNLKLEEYTGYGNKETFTYGLEFKEIAMGIKDIHENRVIHRDLKLGNLFLS